MEVSKETMRKLCGGEFPKLASGLNYEDVDHYILEDNQFVPYDGRVLAPHPNLQIIAVSPSAPDNNESDAIALIKLIHPVLHKCVFPVQIAYEVGEIICRIAQRAHVS